MNAAMDSLWEMPWETVPQVHVCSWDQNGDCRGCSNKLSNMRLMANGRTGEIEPDTE